MSSFENAASPAKRAQSDDELSFIDMVTFLRRHRLGLLGGALAGGALGLAMAFLLPAEWEANVLVRVGQLGKSGAPIESPVRVAERVQYRPFEDDVLNRLGISPNEPGSKARLFRSGLKVTVGKSELLNLRMRGASQEEAKRFASAVVEELKDVHAKMADPTIDRWRKELEEVNLQLKRASSESELLTRVLGEQSKPANDGNLYRAVVASNILLAHQAGLQELRDRKLMLEVQLSPEQTFPTSSLGRIDVSERPVFPKKPILLTVGLLMGLLTGLLLSVLRSAGIRRNA